MTNELSAHDLTGAFSAVDALSPVGRRRLFRHLKDLGEISDRKIIFLVWADAMSLAQKIIHLPFRYCKVFGTSGFDHDGAHHTRNGCAEDFFLRRGQRD